MLMNENVTLYSKLLGCDVDSDLLMKFLGGLANVHPLETSEHLGYFECIDSGIAVMLKTGSSESGQNEAEGKLQVEAIHFYAEGYEGYKQYKGVILDAVEFLDSCQVLRSKLGQPHSSGGGNPSSVMKGKVWPKWDRYDFADCSVRFQFNDAECLNVVTVMGPAGTGRV